MGQKNGPPGKICTQKSLLVWLKQSDKEMLRGLELEEIAIREYEIVVGNHI